MVDISKLIFVSKIKFTKEFNIIDIAVNGSSSTYALYLNGLTIGTRSEEFSATSLGVSSQSIQGIALQTTQRTNLVTNPSFETNTTGWTGTGLSRVAGGYVGSYSLQSITTALDQLAQIALDVAASITYTASGYVLAEAGKKFRILITERNAANGFIGQSLSDDITGTGAWQRVSVTRPFG